MLMVRTFAITLAYVIVCCISYAHGQGTSDAEAIAARAPELPAFVVKAVPVHGAIEPFPKMVQTIRAKGPGPAIN